MILSRARRYILVHIPKTGGTSMALALEDRAMADDVLVGDTPKARQRRKRLRGIPTAGRLWKHSTLAAAEGLITRAERPGGTMTGYSAATGLSEGRPISDSAAITPSRADLSAA